MKSKRVFRATLAGSFALTFLPLSAHAQSRAWVPGPLVLDSTRLVQLRDRREAHWQTQRTSHLVLYADSGSYAAAHFDSLAARGELAYASDLRLLGLARYPHRIYVFYYDSASALQAATGRSGTGGGFPEAQTVFLVANASEPVPADAHEIAHVISLTTWGLNRAEDVWLREGLAVLAQPECWAASIPQLAAATRRAGDARTLADLSGAGFFAGDRDARFRAYMISAAFVQELLQRFGVTKLEEFWRKGPQTADRLFGTSLDSAESRWAAALPLNDPLVRTIDLVAVQRAGCRR
jgi:hypothetical protein